MSSFTIPPKGLEQSPGLFRVAKEDVVIPQGNGFADIKAAKGDLIFADFAKAHMNVRLSLLCVFNNH